MNSKLCAARRRWLIRGAAIGAATVLPHGLVSGQTVLAPLESEGTTALATDASRAARARAWFTETALIDQDNQRHALYSDLIAPRSVLISAVFVGCSSACPLLTRHLLQTRERLGERFGRDIWFLSITVDPLNDGPQQLKRFAQRQGADHPGWRFLTGPHGDVERVMRRLGLWVDQPDGHQTGLIAGQARKGRWGKLRPDGSAQALVQQLERFLDPT